MRIRLDGHSLNGVQESAVGRVGGGGHNASGIIVLLATPVHLGLKRSFVSREEMILFLPNTVLSRLSVSAKPMTGKFRRYHEILEEHLASKIWRLLRRRLENNWVGDKRGCPQFHMAILTTGCGSNMAISTALRSGPS